jgi:hypothetical protein
MMNQNRGEEGGRGWDGTPLVISGSGRLGVGH